MKIKLVNVRHVPFEAGRSYEVGELPQAGDVVTMPNGDRMRVDSRAWDLTGNDPVVNIVLDVWHPGVT